MLPLALLTSYLRALPCPRVYYNSMALTRMPRVVWRTCTSLLEAVTQILLLLLLAFENGNLNSNGVVAVEKSIASCQQGIEKIEKKLDKVKVTSINPGRREKIKAQFRKTLSLFKENTLIKLKATWERAAR